MRGGARRLEAAGIDVSLHELTQEIEERDRLDQSRAISPLRKAPDATLIDSSDLSVEQVVERICASCNRSAHMNALLYDAAKYTFWALLRNDLAHARSRCAKMYRSPGR